MKRFVTFVPKFDNWGNRISIVKEINEYANKNDLTIITVAPTSDGVYVVYEEGGE